MVPSPLHFAWTLELSSIRQTPTTVSIITTTRRQLRISKGQEKKSENRKTLLHENFKLHELRAAQTCSTKEDVNVWHVGSRDVMHLGCCLESGDAPPPSGRDYYFYVFVLHPDFKLHI